MARRHTEQYGLLSAIPVPGRRPLDRAAVALPRQAAGSEPPRPGEPARRPGGEASQVTRTVQQPQQRGYVTRVPTPKGRWPARDPAGRPAPTLQ